MTRTVTDIEGVAAGIAADIANLTPYASRTEHIGTDMALAYAVQDAVVARLLADGVRSKLTGYKVALNSAALMARFNVPEPVSARIFADQRHDSPADLRQRRFLQFAFEPEIAALLVAPLPPRDTPYDRASVAAAIGRLVPAMELLDQRQVDMASSRAPDVVAQNVSNAGIAIGGPGVSPGEFDTLHVTTTVRLDDQVVAEVTDGMPQHPLDVVAWMANHLAERGLQMEAGMVVLCGTHTPIQHPGGATRITVTMSGLGEVSVQLPASPARQG